MRGLSRCSVVGPLQRPRLDRWDRRWSEPALVLRPVLCKCGMAIVWAGIGCPTLGVVAGTKYPVTRANGTADGFPGIGCRTVFLADGVSIRGL